jgi:hypothetical protein
LAIPLVETVFVSQQGDRIQVWTVVDSPTEQEYDAIYAEEASIIRALENMNFDFHVVTRNLRPLSSIVTFSCRGWQRASTQEMTRA